MGFFRGEYVGGVGAGVSFEYASGAKAAAQKGLVYSQTVENYGLGQVVRDGFRIVGAGNPMVKMMALGISGEIKKNPSSQ